VIDTTVFELLHQPDGLALYDLAGFERAVGQDKAIHVATIPGIGPDNEAIRERIGMRDRARMPKRERFLVVVVLSIGSGFVLYEHADGHGHREQLTLCVGL